MDKLFPNTDPTTEIPAANGRTTEFKTYANYLRARIADIVRLVQCFKKHPGVVHADLRFCKVESDRGEMAANIVLSFRHLEDASMRLGKAIQAYDGGVSCYNADMGHGQEIPKPCEAVDAVVGTNAIDLKCSEPWVRDISGNQITDGAYKWLQTLARHIGYELGFKSRANANGQGTYHIATMAGLPVASYGEIKSVFCFLSDKVSEAKQPMTGGDTLSWPAGEVAQPPFVRPPQPFAKEQEFSVWARAKAHELGWQMSTDFNWGHTFAKPGAWSRHFKTEGEIRDFLTRQEKERTEKPFTDESHSA